MTIEIYFKNRWYNITNSVVANSVNLQSRADEAFALGSLVAWLEGIDFRYNIPPYTPILIDNEMYLCGSECSGFLNENGLYIHKFSIIETTAILSCYRVGTKAFSTNGTHTLDFQKVSMLLDLMKDKYSVNFALENLIDVIDNFKKEIKYTFNSRYTLFDCLNEIAEQYDRRVSVSQYNLNTNTIYIDFIGEGTEVVEAPIISYHYTQNSDMYGSTMECEAENVVDRTTLTHAKYLTCRADDVLLDDDHAVLFLPTAVESIDDFGIHLNDSQLDIEIRVPKGTFNVTVAPNGNRPADLTQPHALSKITITKGSSTYNYLNDLYDDVFSKHFSDRTRFFRQNWNVYNNTLSGEDYWSLKMSQNSSVSGDYNITSNGTISLMNRIAEKNQYELLTPQEQSTYAVYTSGTKRIENLNSTYKYDLWNFMFNYSRGNFLEEAFNSRREEFIDYEGILYHIEPLNPSNKPTDYMYYCDYFAIANPLLVDIKDETPINENRVKNYTRNYDTKGGFTDFDKVSTYMHFTNNTSGVVELSVEVDSTSIDIPKARNKFVFDRKTWYISSVSTRFSLEGSISTLNCVSKFSKKAECVQIDSDFESVRNDTKLIVDRRVYADLIFNLAQVPDTTIYMMLTFTQYDTSKIFAFVPCSVMEKDNTYLFYAEMDDESKVASRLSDIKVANRDTLEFYKYTDANNECYSVTLKLVTISNLTKEQSLLLPEYIGGYYTTISSSKTILLYKDARERLTFTIKIQK